jgi:hypothetical protein
MLTSILSLSLVVVSIGFFSVANRRKNVLCNTQELENSSSHCSNVYPEPHQFAFDKDQQAAFLTKKYQASVDLVMHEDRALFEKLAACFQLSMILAGIVAWSLVNVAVPQVKAAQCAILAVAGMLISMGYFDAIREGLECIAKHRDRATDVERLAFKQRTFAGAPKKRILKYAPLSLVCTWALAATFFALSIAYPELLHLYYKS